MARLVWTCLLWLAETLEEGYDDFSCYWTIFLNMDEVDFLHSITNFCILSYKKWFINEKSNFCWKMHTAYFDILRNYVNHCCPARVTTVQYGDKSKIVEVLSTNVLYWLIIIYIERSIYTNIFRESVSARSNHKGSFNLITTPIFIEKRVRRARFCTVPSKELWELTWQLGFYNRGLQIL